MVYTESSVGEEFARKILVLLPAHCHDVVYDQIWSKILQELTKSPARSARALCEH